MAEQSSAARQRRITWAVAIALFLRIALIFAFHTYRFTPTPNNHGFAFETGSIAGSIATGHGFSSPFGSPSGPTAWIAPIYPFLLAMVFKIFGLYTNASAIVMLVFNSICSALTVPFIYRIGRRVFDETVGECAVWIWAAFPFFTRWPVTWIWETSLSALLCAIVFWLSLELKSDDWRRWAGLGALWGVIALGSPSLMGFLPASFLYPAWKLRPRWSAMLRSLVVASLFFVMAIAPWLGRNYAVFHKPVFLRSNFWFEASLSNFPNSNGESWGGKHPSRNARVLQHYIDVGEIAFVAEAKTQVVGFIRDNPREFAKLVTIRIADFWDGSELMYEPANDPFRPWMMLVTSTIAFAGLVIAMVERRRWELFGWLLLLYPIPYYISYTNARYRHPIEPMMVVLTALAVVETARRVGAVKSRKTN